MWGMSEWLETRNRDYTSHYFELNYLDIGLSWLTLAVLINNMRLKYNAEMDMYGLWIYP
jgi:hypothetical protein